MGFVQAVALNNGLLLVDTKYEFGKDSNGTIRLIDEVPETLNPNLLNPKPQTLHPKPEILSPELSSS